MKPNHTAIFVDRSIFEQNHYPNMVKDTGARKSSKGPSTPSSKQETPTGSSQTTSQVSKPHFNKTPTRIQVLPITTGETSQKPTTGRQSDSKSLPKLKFDTFTVPTSELMNSEGFFKAVDSGPDLVYGVGADERSWNPETILPPEPTNPLLKSLADIKGSDSYRRLAGRPLFDDMTSKSSGSGQDEGNDETDTSVQLPSPHPEAESGDSPMSHAASLDPYESSQLDSDIESSDEDAPVLEAQDQLHRLSRRYDLYDIGQVSDQAKRELRKMMANLNLDIKLKSDNLTLDFKVTNQQIGFHLRTEDPEQASGPSSSESNVGNKTITNVPNANINTGTIKRSPKHSITPSMESSSVPPVQQIRVKTPEPEIDSIRRFSIPSILDRSNKVYQVSYLKYKTIFDSNESEVDQFIKILKLEGLYKPYRLTYDLSKMKPLP